MLILCYAMHCTGKRRKGRIKKGIEASQAGRRIVGRYRSNHKVAHIAAFLALQNDGLFNGAEETLEKNIRPISERGI
jgi:hypothetical protein